MLLKNEYILKDFSRVLYENHEKCLIYTLTKLHLNFFKRITFIAGFTLYFLSVIISNASVSKELPARTAVDSPNFT